MKISSQEGYESKKTMKIEDVLIIYGVRVLKSKKTRQNETRMGWVEEGGIMN